MIFVASRFEINQLFIKYILLACRNKPGAMKINEKLIPIKKMMVRPNRKVKMKDFDTAYKGKILNKQESEKMLEASRKYLAEVRINCMLITGIVY